MRLRYFILIFYALGIIVSIKDDSGKDVDTRNIIENMSSSHLRMKRSSKVSSEKERKHFRQKKLMKNTKYEKNKHESIELKKYNSPKQSPTPCRDIACLNNLMQVLKLSKDTVVNFIAQERRLKTILKYAASKKDKNDATESARNYLMVSLGGVNAMKNKRPMCGGHYNSTEGFKGMALYADMTLCSANIQEECDLSLTAQENADISSCVSVMNTFRQGVEDCKSVPTSSGCSCWANVAATVDAVTACRNVASDAAKQVKTLKEKCAATFGECKKYEDSSVEYIYTCKTSSGLLVKLLASLRTAKMVLEKVKAHLSTLLQRMGRAYITKRQTLSILTMISSLVTVIESTSVDSLGTSTAFVALTSSLLQLDTSSTLVTSTEEEQIQQLITSITGTIDTIIYRQSMVIIMLTDLGVTVSSPETAVPDPPPKTTVPSPVTTSPTPVTTVPSLVTTVPSQVNTVPSPVTTVQSTESTVSSLATTLPVNTVPSLVYTVPSTLTSVPSPVSTVSSPMNTTPSPVTSFTSTVATFPSQVSTVSLQITTLPSLKLSNSISKATKPSPLSEEPLPASTEVSPASTKETARPNLPVPASTSLSSDALSSAKVEVSSTSQMTFLTSTDNIVPDPTNILPSSPASTTGKLTGQKLVLMRAKDQQRNQYNGQRIVLMKPKGQRKKKPFGQKSMLMKLNEHKL